jgi:arginyl-tRNA synthetase
VTPEQLSDAVVAALRELVDGGELALPDGVPSEVTIERPRQQGHGDYATNVALQLAKKAGTNPRELAGKLAAALQDTEGIAVVEVAGPGFLNITVEAGSQGQIAQDIVAAGAAYGSSDLLNGQRINLEFVSANPTGPLHLGGTRWAAVGGRPGADLHGVGGRGHAGVLLQRPRGADRPVRPVAAGERAR